MFVTAAVRDITERRKVEAKFRGLLESAPDAMVIVNRGRDRARQHADREALRLRRRRAARQERRCARARALSRQAPHHRDGYFHDPRVRAMGSGLELYGLRKDGTEFPVEISLSPLDTEEGVLVSAAIRDITERMKVEAKFRGFLEAAPDAVVIVERPGQDRPRQLADREAVRLPARRALLGKPVEMLVPERFRGRHPAHRTAISAVPGTRSMGSGLELAGLRADGSEFPVEISSEPARDRGGRAGLGRHPRHHRAQEGRGQVPRPARVGARRHGHRRATTGASRSSTRRPRSSSATRRGELLGPAGGGAGAGALPRQTPGAPLELLRRAPKRARWASGLELYALRADGTRVPRRDQPEPASRRRRGRAGVGRDPRHHRAPKRSRKSGARARSSRSRTAVSSSKSRTGACRRPTA